jgi:uncharacterized protein
MPRLIRVTLPVRDLAQARSFYGTLLGGDGLAGVAGWHNFTYGDATLSCREVAAPAPLSEPVCIAVEEPIVQVHYRAQTLGAKVDPEARMLPTGEQGFEMRDPWGNVLWLVEARSVAPSAQPRTAQPALDSGGATIAVGTRPDDGGLSLQRDFINAVKGGNLQLVTDLLEIDADLARATDAAGISVLLLAEYKQHQAIADVLMRKVTSLTLWEAAAYGSEEWLRHLFAAGASVNAFAPDGFTPLGLACFFGHPACVRMLLEQGADPKLAAQNEMRVCPIHSAVARADEADVLAVVQLLLAAGADVNAVQQGGYTALHQAADRGHASVVKALLAAGAQADARAANGRTAADHAQAQGHAAVVALLKA